MTAQNMKVLVILLISASVTAALTMWLYGYHPTTINGSLHIPLLQAKLDPELYPRDYILRLPQYDSLLWTLVAGLARLIGLGKAMFIGCWVQNMLFHFSVAVLALALCRNVLWSVLICGYFAVVTAPFIGASFFYSPSRLTHTGFSVPIILFAAACLFQKKWLWGSLLWGTAALIHVPNAVYASPLLLVLCLAPAVERIRHVRLMAGIALVSVCVFGILGYVYMRYADSRTISWEYFEQILRSGGIGETSYHMYWSKNFHDSTNFGFFLSQLSMIAAALAISWKRLPCMRVFIIGYTALLLPFVLAYLGPALHSVTITRMMWMRCADFVCLFGLVYSVAIAGNRGLIAQRYLSHCFFGFIILMAALARWNPTFYHVGAAAFILLFLPMPLRIPFRYKGLIPEFNIAAPLFLFSLTLLVALQTEWRMSIFTVHTNEENPQYVETQKWAAANTSKDAMFLTPPFMSGWRVYSKRSTYLEVRDRASAVLGTEVASEFGRRCSVLGYPLGDFKDETVIGSRFSSFSDEQLTDLAKKENIDYAVYPTAYGTNLPVVFKNNWYKIIIIKS